MGENVQNQIVINNKKLLEILDLHPESHPTASFSCLLSCKRVGLICRGTLRTVRGSVRAWDRKVL